MESINISKVNASKKPLLNSNIKLSTNAKLAKKHSSTTNIINDKSIPPRTQSEGSNNRSSFGRNSFNSDDSFHAICSGPPIMNEKPS